MVAGKMKHVADTAQNVAEIAAPRPMKVRSRMPSCALRMRYVSPRSASDIGTQGLLSTHALRDIARYLGEAEHVALFVPDGIDIYMGPEAASVLSQAPAFYGYEPLRCGRAMFARRARGACQPPG